MNRITKLFCISITVISIGAASVSTASASTYFDGGGSGGGTFSVPSSEAAVPPAQPYVETMRAVGQALNQTGATLTLIGAIIEATNAVGWRVALAALL